MAPPTHNLHRSLQARPFGVYFLVFLAYLAAILLALGARIDYDAGRGTPRPGADPAIWLAAGHQAALHVPYDLGAALAFSVLGTCLWLGVRWVYLTCLSLTAAACATFLILSVNSYLYELRLAALPPPDYDTGMRFPDFFLWLPLSFGSGWLLALFLTPGVRRFFRRSPPPPRGT
jgi:hypothetical protein